MYSYDLIIPLGTAGQTLTASVVDRTNTPLASQPAYIITEDGNGFYTYYTDVMPDNQRGKILIKNGSVIVGMGIVSPQDSEALPQSLYVSGSIVDVAPTAGSFLCNLSLSAQDNFYRDMFLVFTSGVLAGIGERISSYGGATRNMVFNTVFPAVPANGDSFKIIGRIVP